MKKFLKGVAALALTFSLVACANNSGNTEEPAADETKEEEEDTTPTKGLYQIYNTTGEALTELYIYKNGESDKGTNYAESEDWTHNTPAMLEIDLGELPANECHGIYTLEFTTEGGWTGKFETLSHEEAPVALLSEDAASGATNGQQISFFEPMVEGDYDIYNVTGEKVTELYIYVNGETDKGENYAAEGLDDGATVHVHKDEVPASTISHLYTIEYVTESGRTGAFENLSQETAPISLLAEDDMTGPSPISFFAPEK